MTLAVSERLDEINLDQFSTTEHALYRALRRREWDSLPLCPEGAKTRRKQGFLKSQVGFCDHRCVPPDCPIRVRSSGDFEVARDGELLVCQIDFSPTIRSRRSRCR